MQNQQPGQTQQWFNKQQPQIQQNQQIIIQRQGMGMQGMGQGFGPGPSGGFMARPRQQMPGEFFQNASKYFFHSKQFISRNESTISKCI